MIRKLSLTIAVAASLCLPASAGAFDITSFSGGAFNSDGTTFSQAGGHPDDLTTTITFPSSGFFPDGHVRDVDVDLPPGLVGNPSVIPSTCVIAQLTVGAAGICPVASQVGTALVENVVSSSFVPVPVFLMRTPVGSPAQLGFRILGSPVLLYPRVRTGDYGLSVLSREISQAVGIKSTRITIWGTPADPSHDVDRGLGVGDIPCAGNSNPDCSNSAGYPPAAFLTMPTDCSAGALATTARADSWQEPGIWHTASFDHDTNGNPSAVTDCENVPFDPTISLAATTDQAETATGLNVEVRVPAEGLLNPDGIAQSHIKKTVVTLPRGVTVNPSQAEGLGACSPARYAAETVNSPLGAGCPNDSRLGSVNIDTPLLDEPVEGSIYLAQQDDPKTATPGAENPFDSMLALYVVAKDKQHGILVRLAGKVEPDPVTGQITSTFDDLPQLPFSKFTLKFREGQRAPLVSPPACGTYTTKADFVPYSAADPDNPKPAEIVTTTSQFQITRGVGGSACPTGGTPAFKPGLLAGTINNAAGAYSPFYLRLTRDDGEQEFTNFSIKLPPGVTGKLAGIPFCPDAAIAQARTKTGTDELQNPSCPKASEVGRTLAGAGVGPLLTYVPGKVYLAGPYNGSALSMVDITPAKVGPFDIGTVVSRQALKVNPDTAEVFIDAASSDPIPHILKGIPVHARDIRAYIDRPDFTLNPTNCKRTSTASTLLGSGLDFGSAVDDNPFTVTSPFQAADCAALGFKPKLDLRLIGGTKRAQNPKLRAVVTARPGDANIGKAQVTLPRSEFLDQSHIKTVCTRVQFAQGSFPGEKCPPGSVYGYAKAFTPLLDEPLQGPVFLRSSSNPLPDLVVALHSGKIDVNLVGRIDSVKGGGIRNTFTSVPDAPVTKFVLTMQGGNKGLLVNSTNLCRSTNRAKVAFDGQNGKIHDFNPVVRPTGCRKGKKRR